MKNQNDPTISFDQVKQHEFNRLKERRKLAGQPEGNPSDDAVGLSFSGGGIRSATFNLGLLQAMKAAEVLEHIDYLSTVSGGGYIGSSLTWFMSNLKKTFPFGTKRLDYSELGGKVLYWLRAHGIYLTPGDGISLWSLIAAVFTGILINLFILVPVFMLAFLLLSINLGVRPPGIGFLKFKFGFIFPSDFVSSGFTWLLWLGLLLAVIFFLQIICFAFTTRIKKCRNFIIQRRSREISGQILMYSIILMVLGSIPIVHGFLAQNIPSWIEVAISSFSFSGIISIVGSLFGRKKEKEFKGVRAFFLSLGLILLVYGIFLWLYHPFSDGSSNSWWLLWVVLLSVVLAIVADVNQVSMHRYYRNRLMEAYLPYRLVDVDVKEADMCLMKDIPQTTAPYHVICCNLNTVGSRQAKYRGRGGDSFIFSPLYCGAASTGYIATEQYIGGNSNLATAFAVSGAAVDPNTYMTRSRPLTFLMTLLNVRLGYWIENPGVSGAWRSFLRPAWYYYMFTEMFGKGLNEERNYIHLSDGGHFENLGLYELIRRKCRYIIVSDAGADPHWRFSDLARCIEMVRVDFGAKVELDVSPMKPDKSTGLSREPYAVGTVKYDDGTKAKMIYIKTSMIEGLPEDLYGYHRVNPTFPDQSTMDQFFDEIQFEAYRELGFRIGERVCSSDEIKVW